MEIAIQMINNETNNAKMCAPQMQKSNNFPRIVIVKIYRVKQFNIILCAKAMTDATDQSADLTVRKELKSID